MPLQALLLAAGSSQRFTGNKLLRPLPSSQCLLDRCYHQAACLTDQVLVVVRDDPQILRHCRTHDYPCLVNTQSHTGMASSIVAGVTATADASGWAIFLADMPCIETSTLHTLAKAWHGHDITVPVWQAQTGHPVIFSRNMSSALLSLRGDRGARQLMRNNSSLHKVITNDAGVCFDIDTEADWATYLDKKQE